MRNSQALKLGGASRERRPFRRLGHHRHLRGGVQVGEGQFADPLGSAARRSKIARRVGSPGVVWAEIAGVSKTIGRGVLGYCAFADPRQADLSVPRLQCRDLKPKLGLCVDG